MIGGVSAIGKEKNIPCCLVFESLKKQKREQYKYVKK